MEKDELLRVMTTTHRDVALLVERIDDDRLLDPAMDDWTGKDVLAHLAWWQDHSAQVIVALCAGRVPDDQTDPSRTTDEINESVFREHVNDLPEETRVAFSQSFERLLAAVSGLTDEELFDPNRWPWLEGAPLSEMLQWDTSRHYDAHLGNLAPLARKAEM